MPLASVAHQRQPPPAAATTNSGGGEGVRFQTPSSTQQQHTRANNMRQRHSQHKNAAAPAQQARTNQSQAEADEENRRLFAEFMRQQTLAQQQQQQQQEEEHQPRPPPPSAYPSRFISDSNAVPQPTSTSTSQQQTDPYQFPFRRPAAPTSLPTTSSSLLNSLTSTGRISVSLPPRVRGNTIRGTFSISIDEIAWFPRNARGGGSGNAAMSGGAPQVVANAANAILNGLPQQDPGCVIARLTWWGESTSGHSLAPGTVWMPAQSFVDARGVRTRLAPSGGLMFKGGQIDSSSGVPSQTEKVLNEPFTNALQQPLVHFPIVVSPATFTNYLNDAQWMGKYYTEEESLTRNNSRMEGYYACKLITCSHQLFLCFLLFLLIFSD